MLRKYIFIKSVTDYIFGLTILLITLPFTLLISLLLALLFKSSPFIIQKRGITEGNKVFNIFKFKTMQPIKCIFNKEYNPLPEMGDILFKKQLEEYVPTFCRWLRKRGLDELPQLINVLKGEMSLIGPRPLM